MLSLLHFILTVLLVFCSIDAWAQSGHAIGSNRVLAEGREHFENWTIPVGTIVIDDGGVRPRKLRRHTNAVLDAVDFLRLRRPDYLSSKTKDEIELVDAVRAGSNRETVVNALDGDMSTYWEPDSPSEEFDLASQWWFTVDLGRTVIANRIVLRFVSEGEGDPFLLFDVLISDGQKPPSAIAGDQLDYLSVLQTQTPNKTQRVFEVDLSNTPQASRLATVRFVQVLVRASDLDRGQEVSEAQYLELPQEDRGRIEYTKLIEGLREFPVQEGVYAQLPDDHRGAIHHYRRERPRLAELEVWGDGDEIVHQVEARGGSYRSRQEHNTDLLTDGDVQTKIFFDVSAFEVGSDLDEFLIDLGASYWIDAQRMITNFKGSVWTVSFGDYWLDFSDGTREPDGSFEWQRVASVEQPSVGERGKYGGIVRSGMHVDRNDFDLVKARLFRLVFFADLLRASFSGGTPAVNLAELQLFGSGFLPGVSLESDPIRLPGSQNLTEIEWQAETPPGTKVVMQTKTGDVLIPDTLYYHIDGSLIGRGEPGSKKYYGRAFKKFQGEKVVIFEEGPEWSPLSALYEDHTGSAITSPAPRRIIKIRATLLSDDPDTAATLKSVVLKFSDPVARRLLGEIMPTRVEALGVERPFSLYVGVDTLEQAFDELLLQAPVGMVLGASADVEDRVQLFAGQVSELETLEEDPGAYRVGELDVLRFGDSLHVKFPVIESDVEVLRLDFPATLYSAGGQIAVSLRLAQEEFWQRVDVGDVLPAVESNALTVVALPRNKELFQGLRVDPRVATPNGDGINEEVVFEFTVVLLGVSRPVQIEIYDLGGHLVRRVEEIRPVSTGHYRIGWDGLDVSGKLAPPGIYVARLGLDADTEGAGVAGDHALETIALAY